MLQVVGLHSARGTFQYISFLGNGRLSSPFSDTVSGGRSGGASVSALLLSWDLAPSLEPLPGRCLTDGYAGSCSFSGKRQGGMVCWPPALADPPVPKAAL